jgi:hypothetical protein
LPGKAIEKEKTNKSTMAVNYPISASENNINIIKPKFDGYDALNIFDGYDALTTFDGSKNPHAVSTKSSSMMEPNTTGL